MKWKEAVANGKLKVAQPKGIYPNLLAWIDGNPRVGAVVVFQSESDFALGKAGLDYVTCVRPKVALTKAGCCCCASSGADTSL